jgi:hypothetical protein
MHRGVLGVVDSELLGKGTPNVERVRKVTFCHLFRVCGALLWHLMYIGEKCCILLANMVPDLPFGATMECSEHFIARVTFGKHIIALVLFGGNPSGEGEIEKNVQFSPV